MTRLWTIIGVVDVIRSFAWHQSLLGLPTRLPMIISARLKQMAAFCFAFTGGETTTTRPLLALIVQSLATGRSCSFVWMNLAKRCLGRALSFLRSRRSRISTPTGAPESLRYAILTATTSWSVLSLSGHGQR